MNPITAVVLGAGSRGSTYAGYAKEHPEELKIVAIAEPRKDRLDALAEEVGVPQEYRFRHWEELLAQPKLADCAFICTLDDDHTAPALKAMERGEYTPELAAELKEKLSTVFNRGFWEGYYAGRDIAEHTARYGSSATQRKVYIGKVTNFFKKISVAEVLVEAAPVNRGDQLIWMGETTGVLEMEAEGLVLKEQVVDHIPQGTYFSIKMPQTLRRGDKLYKMVPSEEVDQVFTNV